jgi:hypothetical protein
MMNKMKLETGKVQILGEVVQSREQVIILQSLLEGKIRVGDRSSIFLYRLRVQRQLL